MSRLRELREAKGLSQVTLADLSKLTRQSVGAIEASRAVPSVDVALRLAAALDCTVEELFGERPQSHLISAELDARSDAGRAALARIRDRWVAYPLTGEDAFSHAAGGLIVSAKGDLATLEPLQPTSQLENNIVIAGCASGLGVLADKLNVARGPGHYLWFSRSNSAALEALRTQRTHVAGVHLSDTASGEGELAELMNGLPKRELRIVTLAHWEVGLLSRPGSAERVMTPRDLAQPKLRIVARENGAGAQRLLERVLREQKIPLERARKPHVRARSHMGVAQSISLGAADVGMATRDVARAFGLNFVAVREERFDLLVLKSIFDDARVQRFFDGLTTLEVRRELASLEYDVRDTGRLITPS